MATHVLVQVPTADAADLDLLRTDAGAPIVSTVHPFDGETVAQVLLSLSALSIPVLRAWILARVEERKNYQVVINGVTLSGYKPDEVREILSRIEKADESLDQH